MIIVIKGADFSVNKIGNVVIPRDNLDTTTQSILNNYTKSVNQGVIYAFDDLVKSLKTNGIWNKIVFAYFPFLANTVSEALFEAKNNTPLSGTINSASVITTGYELDQYGLKTKKWVSGDGLNISSLAYTYGINSNSAFISVLVKKGVTNDTLYFASTPNNAHLGNVGLKPRLLLTNSGNSIEKTGVNSFANYNIITGNVRMPGNSEQTLDICHNGNTSYTFSNTGSYANQNSLIKECRVATAGYGQYFYNTWPVAIQLIGHELTQNEVLIMNNILTSFNEILIA